MRSSVKTVRQTLLLSLLLGAGTVTASQQMATVQHIQLATSSVTEAVKWYAEHLDCQPVNKRPETITCSGMTIEFTERPSVGGSQGTGINHISFGYTDVAAKMAALESVGVRGSGVRLQRFADGATVQTVPGLFKHGFVFDPWGTRIELVEAQRAGFHHIHLQSADPLAAAAWYETVLGGDAQTFRRDIAAVVVGEVLLLIDPYSEGRPAPTDERAIDHIGFVVADIDDARAHMTRLGVHVQPAVVPEHARSQARRAFFSGPDGVLLAAVEPTWQGVARVQAIATDQVAANEPFVTPRTPWGEPDFQGIWTANAAHGIPLERPEDVADDRNLTAEEAAARRERGTLGSIWGYEREWRDTTLGYVKSAPSTQLAMIIDPPDGRLPPLTAKGQAAMAAIAAARAAPKLAGGPEDLSNYVRCITRGLPSMMMPSIYNNGLQIVQSPGYVAIQKEMIHETRVIPTRAQAPQPPGLQQWLGTSRGRWQNDTLVVEVRNFNGRATFRGAGKNLQLTERYRLVGPARLEYTFTVDDPTIWTTPWTGRFHFDRDDGQYDLVEYACHEGNYGMTNILSAARARERQNSESAGGGGHD